MRLKQVYFIFVTHIRSQAAVTWYRTMLHAAVSSIVQCERKYSHKIIERHVAPSIEMFRTVVLLRCTRTLWLQASHTAINAELTHLKFV